MNEPLVFPVDNVEVLPAPTTDAAIMTRCSECHHLVPEANMAIHQATVCQHERRNETGDEQQTAQEPRDESPPQQQGPRNWFLNLFNKRTTDYPGQRQVNTQDDWHLVQREDAVEETGPRNEWQCPRCTLDNSNSLARCSACNYARPEPDSSSSRQEQSSSPQPQQQEEQSSGNRLPPGSFLGGGAVIGGILGGLFGALVGNPIGGAIEGCMNGAFSGAIIENAARVQQQREQQQQQMASARGHQHHGRMPMTRIRYPDGRVQIVAGDPNMIRAAMMQQHPRNGGISFQQVLNQSLNEDQQAPRTRGADQQTLASLPVTRVKKDEKGTDSCPICLETFKEGDSYKTLPCMHGFHSHCADHWLRKNASCPMCKHAISS